LPAARTTRPISVFPRAQKIRLATRTDLFICPERRATLLPLVIVCVLILSAARAIAGPVTPAVANISPELQAPYNAFLVAKAQDKDAACNTLIDAYLPSLRHGNDAAGVDVAIVDYLSIESRATLAARLAIDGVFSPLEETCLSRNDGESPNGLRAELAASGKGLYFGLKALAGKGGPNSSQWPKIARGLREGWRYFPSPLYAAQLEDALRRAKDRRGLFEFKAYRYFDEGRPNPFRYLGLLSRWFSLPGRKAFGAEIAAVKKSIKDDIMRTSPEVTGLPSFGGDTFFTSAGAPRSLAFRDPASELHGKRAVFAFFQTTCSYCVDELSALGRLVPLHEKKSPGRLAVVGVKLPTNLPAAISALAPFEKALAVPFPLLENDASGIAAAYGVRAVPLLIFFDERGAPLWTVALRGQARIDEKLSWFLDDFLADGQSVTTTRFGPGPSPIVMDMYLDPSDAASRQCRDTVLPAIAHSLGAGIQVVAHDIRRDAVMNAMDDRLAALRVMRAQMPVITLGKVAIQGLAPIQRELPEAIRLLMQARR
jgi:hypothetical protein